MKKLLLAGVAALFLATGTAHAGNCREYQCGKVEVGACIYKENGRPAGDQIVITVPFGVPPDKLPDRRSSGVFVYNEIDSPIGYLLNGRKYRCKEKREPPKEADND